MDSLTQIVLGAAVGEVAVGPQGKNKGLLWGAVCGTIPDLDLVFGYFMSDLDKNTFHRSISHSLLFFLLASPLTGWLLKWFYSRCSITMKQWTLMAFWVYLTHALLDCFTTWGTQLFWPLDHKIAFKSIFVIDPLYTLPFLFFLLMGVRLSSSNPIRKKWVWLGIGISSCYLVFTLVNKQIVGKHFEQSLERESIAYSRLETKPAPFNNILWAATAETPEGYYVGYYSLLDERPTTFQFFPKNHMLLEEVISRPDVQQLVQLTEGWYSVEKISDGLKINDLRFGTLSGWERGNDFVFAYNLQFLPDGDIHISEAPKTLKDDPRQILSKLFTRMMGN